MTVSPEAPARTAPVKTARSGRIEPGSAFGWAVGFESRWVWRVTANLLTLTVLALGLGVAVHPAQAELAALGIGLAGVLDALDGLCARRAGGPTRLGGLLDLVADWTAFGLAPAAVAWAHQPPGPLSPWLMLALIVFLSAALARLFRTNFLLGPGRHEGYVGMPMPALGCGMLGLGVTLPTAGMVIPGALLLAVLAVSGRNYPGPSGLWRRSRYLLVAWAFLTGILLVVNWPVGLLVGAGLYALAPWIVLIDAQDARTPVLPRAPGPSFLRLLLSAPRLVLDPIAWFTALWRRYGDVVRIQLGPVWVLHLVVHPDQVARVLGTHHANYPKFILFPLFRTGLGQGLVSSEGEHWRRQRRLLQPVYHPGNLGGIGADMGAVLVDRLASWSAGHLAGRPFDVELEMRSLAQCVILHVLFHADMEAEVEAVRGTFLCAAPWSLVVGDLNVPARKRFNTALAVLEGRIAEIIAERRDHPRREGDLLDAMLAARHRDTAAGMSDRDLRDEVLTALFAGHDTVSEAMTWLWYMLAREPAVEARVHAELDRALGGRAPEVGDLPRLEYVGRVCQEVLRMIPPIWVGGRRAVQEDVLGGYAIPAGSLVAYSPYLTHRHPKFWTEPEQFDPDRFRPSGLAQRPATAYLPFGTGARVCIGRFVAMAEMQLVTATVAQRFRLRLTSEEPVAPDGRVGFVRPRHSLKMVLESREEVSGVSQ